MRLAYALMFLAILGAAPAYAQRNGGGALPPSIASAGITQTEWAAIRQQARMQARRAGVAEAALLAAAEGAGTNLARSGRFDAAGLQQAIFDRLADQADQIADLQRRLGTIAGAADPGIGRVYADARTALNDGRLADADRLLSELAQRDLAALQDAEAEVEQRRARAGETIAARGQVAYIQADYLAAAAFYERAAATVAQSAIEPRWRYTMYRAEALRQRGDLFNEPEPLREAVRLYRDVALPLAPRELRASDWAITWNDMGGALEVIGQRGDDESLRQSIAAYRFALEEQTRERDPRRWAIAQNNLGTALRQLGERGDPEAGRAAIEAHRAALTVVARRREPELWPRMQNNLGIALLALGENGDERALRDAIAAFRAVLEVESREQNPRHWGSVQNNLGVALSALGERVTDVQSLRAAAAAHRASLEVWPRERYPADWAAAQGNLGRALALLGHAGDQQALRDSIAAFRASLEVNTRERNPAEWARGQGSIGAAYYILGNNGDRQALRDAIVAIRLAMEVDTRERDAPSWARHQYNLANAFASLAVSGEPARLPDAYAAARSALDAFRQLRDDYGVRLSQSQIAALDAFAAANRR
ncbi:MAG: hypothetical protein AB7T59_15400 [Hyphomonadaceae bacterium]